MRTIFCGLLIIFAIFAGCKPNDPPRQPNDFTGTLTITGTTNADGTRQTNKPLTANYTGTETVTITYEWKKDGVAVGTNSSTYTPTEEGQYTVTISAANYNPLPSGAVTVKNGNPLRNWVAADWETWLNTLAPGGGYNGDGEILGVDSVEAFCEWANEHYPNRIPKNPYGSGNAWSHTFAHGEWDDYMDQYPNLLNDFPGDFYTFLDWAGTYFPEQDMPSIPPAASAGAVTNPQTDVEPALSVTEDRSLEDAGMTEIQP